MKELIDFFLEVGKLKEIPKKGWILIGVKDPESIVEHSFQVALMAWLLAERKKVRFDQERLLKIALAHDLCEVYAGDETPYDKILPKNKKDWPELFDKWPRAILSQKRKSYQERRRNEKKSLEKLLSRLSAPLKREILELWLDYEEGKTKEARFVKQVNRIQTLMQALDYGRRHKIRVYKSWWIGSKEKIDDPQLLEAMKVLEEKFTPRALRKAKQEQW